MYGPMVASSYISSTDVDDEFQCALLKYPATQIATQ